MSEDLEPPKKKTKWYPQTFKSDWLDIPAFKDWLHQEDNECVCKWCRCTLKNAKKSSLLQHNETVKHKKNFKKIMSGSCIDLGEFLNAKQSTDTKPHVIKRETYISGYFIQVSVIHIV